MSTGHLTPQAEQAPGADRGGWRDLDTEGLFVRCGWLVDRFLDERLPPADTGPGSLHAAIRYCVFAGGKRFRPALTIAACEAFGGEAANALPSAAAIEMIHVSSLVHDDLPCMDDADLRRGKPACHLAFDEATAVLVGDWLIAYPFQVLCQAVCDGTLSPAQACAQAREIARAVCSEGIVAGQVADLEAETRTIDLDELRTLHKHKTGSLIRASARCGMLAAGVDPARLDGLGRFSELLGLAFQVVDDILDVTADTATLGKPAGADDMNNKSTYVSLLGLDEAQRVARRAVDDAHALVDALSDEANVNALHALVEFVIQRGS